ncbi:MAG: DNA-3-methyladenine glycosylase 1 [Burkholderia gladioli]|nr:MAG: DNA-3-methyladenine glycosylase 1 [Burkholderia gladioli]
MSERCNWVRTDADAHYHDTEWGRPAHDERYLFEMLILEGAQAGLSWSTILNKREGYRAAFANFDADAVARFTPAKVDTLMQNAGIVRNRAKIESTIVNARAVQRIRAEHGSLGAFLWSFVGGVPIQNGWRSYRDGTGRRRRLGRHEQGAQGLRLQVRRLDDLLRADAGHRHGQRSRIRLPVPRCLRGVESIRQQDCGEHHGQGKEAAGRQGSPTTRRGLNATRRTKPAPQCKTAAPLFRGTPPLQCEPRKP